MNQIEHMHQAALIKWWSMYATSKNIIEELLFAVPNGGARDVITGARLKAEGVRRGVPDLFLAIPKNDYHGLFLEMKAEKGRCSEYQKSMIERLSKQGFCCKVCHGWVDAREVIQKYLG